MNSFHIISVWSDSIYLNNTHLVGKVIDHDTKKQPCKFAFYSSVNSKQKNISIRLIKQRYGKKVKFETIA